MANESYPDPIPRWDRRPHRREHHRANRSERNGLLLDIRSGVDLGLLNSSNGAVAEIFASASTESVGSIGSTGSEEVAESTGSNGLGDIGRGRGYRIGLSSRRGHRIHLRGGVSRAGAVVGNIVGQGADETPSGSRQSARTTAPSHSRSPGSSPSRSHCPRTAGPSKAARRAKPGRRRCAGAGRPGSASRSYSHPKAQSRRWRSASHPSARAWPPSPQRTRRPKIAHGPDECNQQDLAKASEVADDHLEQSVETPSGRKAVVQRSAQRRRLQKRTGEHQDNEVEQEERSPRKSG